MVGKNWFAGTVLVAFAVAPMVVQAQSKEDMALPVPASEAALGGRFGRSSPGVSASSPLAFGPNWRDVFAGIGYQSETRYGGDDDASASFGMGLGDNQRAIGLEVVVTSLSTVRTGLFERTLVGFKAHRQLPMNAAIAVGVEGIKLNGDNFETDASVYGVISKVAALRAGGDLETPFSVVTLNAGLGNGRFCAEDLKEASGLADCGVNFFGSVGLRANQYIGLIGDWTGQDLNLGVSLALLKQFPLVITAAMADVTGSAGDKARFTLGAGVGLRF
jgi:hypothetical protein